MIILKLILVYNFHIIRLIKLYKKSNLHDKSDLLLLKELKFGDKLNILEFGGGDSVSDSPSYIFEKYYKANVYLLEPILESYTKLKSSRPRATIFNLAVGLEKNKNILFSVTETSTLSGYAQFFDQKLNSRRKIIREINLNSLTFSQIMDRYFHQIVFNLVIIDTEGSELEILKTIDFQRFMLQNILVEHNFTDKRDQIYDFLSTKNYVRLQSKSFSQNDLYRLKN
jgi:FkbM family methyltransferase